MTTDQVLLVRSSWAAAAEHSGELSVRFYDHLFATDPTAAQLFAHVDMNAQREKLVRTLAVIVHALDDIDRLLPSIAALGKRHAHYGVEYRHFELVGEALLQAFAGTLGGAFTPAMRTAWTEAYALIASVMKRALDREGRTPVLSS